MVEKWILCQSNMHLYCNRNNEINVILDWRRFNFGYEYNNDIKLLLTLSLHFSLPFFLSTE